MNVLFEDLPQLVIDAYTVTGCKPRRCCTRGDEVCAIGVLSKVYKVEDSYTWADNFFGSVDNRTKFTLSFDCEEYAEAHKDNFFAQLGDKTREAVKQVFGDF